MRNGPYELIVPPKDYPGKRYRGRYAYEHHVVYWSNTGTLLSVGQEIHHKNGNTRDNRFENLELVDGKLHRKIHGQISHNNRAVVELICNWCYTKFLRSKRKVPKDQVKFYCNRSHQISGKHRDLRIKRSGMAE